ncbi:MAG: hypothetical protein AAF443_06135, partial [Chlamydiota bacterium]
MNWPSLLKIGNLVEWTGKNIFLTGSVPAYGLFYALPRKIIQSIPKVMRLLKTSFHRVMVKVSQLAKWVIDHLLSPLCCRILKMLKYGMTKVVDCIEFALQKIGEAAKWIFKNLLIPLWQSVIVPTAVELKRVVKWVITKVG